MEQLQQQGCRETSTPGHDVAKDLDVVLHLSLDAVASKLPWKHDILLFSKYLGLDVLSCQLQDAPYSSDDGPCDVRQPSTTMINKIITLRNVSD